MTATRRQLYILCIWSLLAVAMALSPAGADDIDWNRARQLYQMEQNGQTLSPDDEAYLQRAKQARASKAQQPAQAPRDQTGLVPLTDLTGDYHGEDGGLYGKSRNEPPPEVAAAAKAQSAKIQPLDAQGNPSPDGKIVLLSIGMSNTTAEFSTFITLAGADLAKSPKVILVDGAQGGQTADKIASTEGVLFWQIIEQRLKAAGVTPQQVQVVWLKEAIARPSAGFPTEMTKLKNSLIDDVHIAVGRYPNLRIAYLSSRIYGGYATTLLNPEPYAYESAFADRWAIEAQMSGDASLNFDPSKGAVKAPLLLWGPYLWADGIKGRMVDGLVWNREDFGPDGTHPSRTSGCQKVAQLLLNFFKTDPYAPLWFVGK